MRRFYGKMGEKHKKLCFTAREIANFVCEIG